MQLPVVKSVGLTTSKVRLTQNDKPVTCKVWSYGMAMKGAEHILTYHPGYMYLLNTMKSYIVHKQERPGLAQSDALSDEDDEVSKMF